MHGCCTRVMSMLAVFTSTVWGWKKDMNFKHNDMETPRSRRSPHSPKTRPRTDSLLPYHLYDFNNNTIMQNLRDKKPTTVQVTWTLLLAIALLFTVLLSLKTHLKFTQSVGLESCDMLTGCRKNHLRDDEHFPSANAAPQSEVKRSADQASRPRRVNADRSLKGLLADFDEFEPENCASRGHQFLTTSKYTPSEYLIQQLRKYESFHRKCSGHAEEFVNGTELKGDSQGECRYVVWIAYSGLGNRLLSLASSFLYALLTNRILLVDRSTDMSELFCEPFPGTSWLVPPDFPHMWLEELNESSHHRFGSLFNQSMAPPAFGYVHLTHTYDLDDRMFFCDQGQNYLNQIPWLFMRSNNYIVPGLYFLSSFRPHLEKLFPGPGKEAIFHLLGRYLFHPSNDVWGWISRFRRAYLANNDEQIGIQIRTFKDTPQAYFQEQLSRCTLGNKLLPNITASPTTTTSKRAARMVDAGSLESSEGSNRLISILMTSLQPEYFEKMRDFYMSAPTEDGQFVAVHQPSNEGWQKTDSFGHDLKAWADIYLLCFSDVLITSGWSTFGYSAQALAGLKPWILSRSMDGTVPNPACVYARSMEPCFHTPPLMDCENTGISRNPSTILPYVQTCEDIPWGIKVIDAEE